MGFRTAFVFHRSGDAEINWVRHKSVVKGNPKTPKKKRLSEFISESPEPQAQY